MTLPKPDKSKALLPERFRESTLALFGTDESTGKSTRLYCNHCGDYVGVCGHQSGAVGPVTLSGTCKCGCEFSVTCNCTAAG